MKACGIMMERRRLCEWLRQGTEKGNMEEAFRAVMKARKTVKGEVQV